jgi:hypothetical protein
MYTESAAMHLPDPPKKSNAMLNAVPQYSTLITTAPRSSSYLLLQHLLRLVDFGGEVGAASAIGVVVQHELAVLLSEELFCDAAFATLY